ncbi:hypothetical protein SUGI_0122230 [Cryptomeria japonica]|nr:hypothetical protein SUGI_0122230 [Cryptomeria japonica]
MADSRQEVYMTRQNTYGILKEHHAFDKMFAKKIGELMAEHLFKLEPENSGNYILLSSIYSAICRWDDAERVRKMMRGGGVSENLECDWIEIDKQ